MSDAYLSNALQDEREIEDFAALVESRNVRSYLEIGAKFGGSLWRVACAMPEGSVVVAVDLPYGTRLWAESEPSLKSCIEALHAKGYKAHLIWGDSTNPNIVDAVRVLGPFDAVLIDANHTRPFLEQDWQNYAPMSHIVAFHDIAWKRPTDWRGVRIDVPDFWNTIKQGHEHVELIHDPKTKDNGIGVLWR